MINGDRRGLNWGSGGGWNDGTANGWPDWLEVQFNGPQTIDEIDVFIGAGQLPGAQRADAEHDVHAVRVAGLRGAVLDGQRLAAGAGRDRD